MQNPKSPLSTETGQPHFCRPLVRLPRPSQLFLPKASAKSTERLGAWILETHPSPWRPDRHRFSLKHKLLPDKHIREHRKRVAPSPSQSQSKFFHPTHLSRPSYSSSSSFLLELGTWNFLFLSNPFQPIRGGVCRPAIRVNLRNSSKTLAYVTTPIIICYIQATYTMKSALNRLLPVDAAKERPLSSFHDRVVACSGGAEKFYA